MVVTIIGNVFYWSILTAIKVCTTHRVVIVSNPLECHLIKDLYKISAPHTQYSHKEDIAALTMGEV